MTRPSMHQPNVLYLHSHDTGRYIQPYGHRVDTPRLQALAESGVVFRHAFAAAPACAPSRAALLTGQAAHSAGMDGLTMSGFEIDCRQHVAAVLNDAGYVTGLAGFQHVVRDEDRDRLPYTHRKPAQGFTTEQWAGGFLRDRALDGQPFFLDVGFMETHRKGPDFWRDEDIPIDARYVSPPARFPDTPEVRLDWARYLASAQSLDRRIGSVLDALAEHGLDRNTLVIFTTDHGLAFPGIKPNATEEGLAVSLIMAGPPLGQMKGEVCDALIWQPDLYPTLCELAQTPTPPWVQARSLWPLLRGEADSLHEAVFGEVTYHGRYDPQRTVRTPRYRLVERFDDEPYPGQRIHDHTDEGPTRELWKRSGWHAVEVPRVQLYDTVFDPMCMNNLAADPDRADVLNHLRRRLRDWMRETGDKLLDGPIPLPGGRDFGRGSDGSIIALPPPDQRVSATTRRPTESAPAILADAT
jgi:N-sulfoglucosamine sulfohydrolase